jgi:4-alpha-glucanotransferase
VREALDKLGVRRLLLAIHDVSFPSDPDEDLGRGTPATRAAERLFAYITKLGFTGIQLGPQGQTARSNPSPYDGTIFSRHLGNVSARTWRALVGDEAVERWLVPGGPARHHHAYDASHALRDLAYREVAHHRDRLEVFKRAHAEWLMPDALHAALCEQFGGAGFRQWPPEVRDGDMKRLAVEHRVAIDRYAFGQLLVHEEHERVRERADRLKLYGDLQVGYSDADAWRFAGTFLRGYLMGAPPSRTNPEGQPWGYPVLDPAQYGGAAGALVDARANKAFTEYDSLRIDHPHGLVCPWVYRSDTGDARQAVRDGARLFESPDLPDHPVLAQLAIARANQLDRGRPRYADDWVRGLDADPIERYAALFDRIVDAAERHRRTRSDLSCEVLSTLPAPLAAMLERHRLGRWRVTQKANLDDPSDVYRTEHVMRADWMMLGNHDTAPILAVIKGWSTAKRESWARHLAGRLHLAQPDRLVDDRFLATCMLAELFLSNAENVSIFFADLFGLEERFNVPGLVDDANWTLRLPNDFENRRGLDVALAADLALAAAVR